MTSRATEVSTNDEVKITNGGTGIYLKWGIAVLVVMGILGIGYWIKGIEGKLADNAKTELTIQESIKEFDIDGTKVSRKNNVDITIMQKDISTIVIGMSKNDSDHDKIITGLEMLREDVRNWRPRTTQIPPSPNNTN
jgi:hypothetical protein